MLTWLSNLLVQCWSSACRPGLCVLDAVAGVCRISGWMGGRGTGCTLTCCCQAADPRAAFVAGCAHAQPRHACARRAARRLAPRRARAAAQAGGPRAPPPDERGRRAPRQHTARGR